MACAYGIGKRLEVKNRQRDPVVAAAVLELLHPDLV